MRCGVRIITDDDHKYWWEVARPNGVIIGRSMKGYTRKIDCHTNIYHIGKTLSPPLTWLDKPTK